MPIFCLGYAQIRTPLGERATMERWFRTQQSSINHTTQGLGKTSAKEFGKCIRLEMLTRKAVSRAQNRLCADPKYTSRFPGSPHRAARLGWSGIFAKSQAKQGLFL